MTAEWVLQVMGRDLRAVAAQLSAYGDERDLWRLGPGMSNSAGTLALHIAGNIRHYIGRDLGGDGYVRDREAEFARRGVARAALLEEIEAAGSALERGLADLGDEELRGGYPEAVGGVRHETGQFLIHLAAHLAYHLGQIDYHRRAITGAGALPGMLSPGALAEEE